MNELEAFIFKAFKGEAIVNYCEPLITQLEDPATRGDERSQLARRVKIDEKKTLSDLPLVAHRGKRVYHSGKMKVYMIFLKPSSIK